MGSEDLHFLHGAGVDEPLQVDSASSSESLLQDHLGSTSQLLDSASGTSKSRYDYKSYGKLEGDIDNRSLINPYTYTGREDDGTGLMYYRARFYDPELEVFISQDPLGDAQRYVGGNPLGFVDPLGLIKALVITRYEFGLGEHVDVLSDNNVLYGSRPTEQFKPGASTLYRSFDNLRPPSGFVYDVFYLDQSIFKGDEPLLKNSISPGYLVESCGRYSNRVVNAYLKKAGRPEINTGLFPDSLIYSLMNRGYITSMKRVK